MTPPNDAGEGMTLEPCPFCGSNPIPWPDDDRRVFAIYCQNCASITGEYPTERAAISAWNCRVQPSPKQRTAREEAKREVVENEVHDIARKVWDYMNRRSCPGITMKIAYEGVVHVLSAIDAPARGEKK